MFTGQLILAAWSMIAAAPESVVLTPATMAEHGYHIHVELFDQTTRKDRQAPPTGPIRVSVHFDDRKGPAIKSVKSGPLNGYGDWGASSFVVMREGDDVRFSVPVHVTPWEGNEGGLYVRFSTQTDLLAKTQLVMYEEGERGPRWVTVDLKAFIEKPVVLTPDTIAEHGYRLRITVADAAKKEGAPPAQPAETVKVSVRFGSLGVSAEELETIGGIRLVAGEEDGKLLNVPFRKEADLKANRPDLRLTFSVQRHLLRTMQLVFDDDGERGRRTFLVNLNDFIKEK
jgi:hypothetical protein